MAKNKRTPTPEFKGISVVATDKLTFERKRRTSPYDGLISETLSQLAVGKTARIPVPAKTDAKRMRANLSAAVRRNADKMQGVAYVRLDKEGFVCVSIMETAGAKAPHRTGAKKGAKKAGKKAAKKAAVAKPAAVAPSASQGGGDPSAE